MPRLRRYVLAWCAVDLLALIVLGALYYCRFASQSSSADAMLSDLGKYRRKITTRSNAAQLFFDQGLIFLYGFDHAEADRSFRAAAENDPNCAMAFWGIAMANGPHINDMVISWRQATAALEAVKTARNLLSGTTPVERALIEAVGTRFSESGPDNRITLDQAYAATMQRVWKTFPEDVDVGALTADALMDLRPWDQWRRDGRPQPGTEVVLAILNDVLFRCPEHPLALHLLIHALEASPNPEKADAAAERLRTLMPGVSHLLHMPSHIDIRRGRWEEAVIANEKAIAVDQMRRRRRPDIYSFTSAHNYCVLVYAAMMQGERAKAVSAIHEMLSDIPQNVALRRAGDVDAFASMHYEVYLRFGLWDAILNEPPPGDKRPITTILWRYARGLAFAAKNKVGEARAEHRAFIAAKEKLTDNSRYLGLRASLIVRIAEQMLVGEILYRQGNVGDAVEALRSAVREEDGLPYTEPPSWLVPVRHALGATLMQAGRLAEAEAVYREDLQRHPKNGWALYGLSRSLALQRKNREARDVLSQYERTWRHADIELTASCLCLSEPTKAMSH